MTTLEKIGFKIGVLVISKGKKYQTIQDIGDWEASWEDETPENFGGICFYNSKTNKTKMYGQNLIPKMKEDFPQFFNQKS